MLANLGRRPINISFIKLYCADKFKRLDWRATNISFQGYVKVMQLFVPGTILCVILTAIVSEVKWEGGPFRAVMSGVAQSKCCQISLYDVIIKASA